MEFNADWLGNMLMLMNFFILDLFHVSCLDGYVQSATGYPKSYLPSELKCPQCKVYCIVIHVPHMAGF